MTDETHYADQLRDDRTIGTVLGMRVVRSRAVPLGEVRIAADPSSPFTHGNGTLAIVHGLEVIPTDADLALWRRETPAQGAARVVRDVLEWHAGGPPGPLAYAARAELDARARDRARESFTAGLDLDPDEETTS